MHDPVLTDLEPRDLWRFFLELSAIPRPSGREGRAADWVSATARDLGCSVERDAVGNVLIRKPASPGREDRPAVALQCHVDMVCEKNEGTPHDFDRDPIRVRREGDLLRATGTTLGADNGIGVATALAVLASTELVHPPLEVLVTVDEESGLTGANGLAGGWLGARRLLNLDSEEEGELTIGCAGGVDTTATRRLTFGPAPDGQVALRVRVSGLKGGHSGVDIEAGRANSLRLLGAALDAIGGVTPVALASISGGNKRNAIAREAAAVVVCPSDRVDPVRDAVARVTEEARLAFGAFDPHIELSVTPATAERVMSATDRDAIVALLLAGPHGVEAMSPDIPGLVQTSTNLGLVELDGDVLSVNFLTRSSIDRSKRALVRRITCIATALGFTCADSNDYPGWKPEPGAAIVKLVDDTHRDLFGKPMLVKAIHAGLECGLIGEKYPGMEMASIGPSMWDVHTPDEHVSIRSVAAFWTLLTGILARI